jgi:hypothetical protein
MATLSSSGRFWSPLTRTEESNPYVRNESLPSTRVAVRHTSRGRRRQNREREVGIVSMSCGLAESCHGPEAVSRTLAARDTSIDAVLTFQVREDPLLTRLQRRACAEQSAQVRERCGAANGLAIAFVRLSGNCSYKAE